jgi:alpha-N-arabinofuranosidase
VCKDSGGNETSLGTGVTKNLSVENIGFDYGMCFTGTYFGLYATGNGNVNSVPADFDWFVYDGMDVKN